MLKVRTIFLDGQKILWDCYLQVILFSFLIFCQARKKNTVHFLQHEATTDQLLVSGADKLDNLRSIHYDKARIGKEIWSRFNASKDQQAWYYQAIAAVLKEKGKDNATLALFGKEMKALCKQVF